MSRVEAKWTTLSIFNECDPQAMCDHGQDHVPLSFKPSPPPSLSCLPTSLEAGSVICCLLLLFFPCLFWVKGTWKSGKKIRNSCCCCPSPAPTLCCNHRYLYAFRFASTRPTRSLDSNPAAPLLLHPHWRPLAQLAVNIITWDAARLMMPTCPDNSRDPYTHTSPLRTPHLFMALWMAFSLL